MTQPPSDAPRPRPRLPLDLGQHDLTVYPLTIVQTRYSGIYEGGKWAAFPADPNDLPEGAFDGDVDCSIWWLEHGADVGIGNTPDAALIDYHLRVLGGLEIERDRNDAGTIRFTERRNP